MIRPVRVLIVDDQALVREGLRTILDLEDDIEVVGEAADGVEALRKIPGAGPEVALVDVRMPRMNGVNLIKRLSFDYPEISAIVLTTFDDEYIFGGLNAGAKGYLLKDTSSEELVRSIERASRGESVLGGEISTRVISELRRLSETAKMSPKNSENLTEREMEVIHLIGSGASNREISRSLHITEGTAKNYISKILKKLDLRDRTQVALYAAERGWAEKKDSDQSR